MNISTADRSTIYPYLQRVTMPKNISHKGQNGKVLVIGGSSLFHGAVLWSAEAVSHIADMVHVASSCENNDIIKSIKTMWQTGMVISQKDMPHYAQEDSVILIGNGMMRTPLRQDSAGQVHLKVTSWEEILAIKDEGIFTRETVYYLISHFPDKQFVFDAGALQMMDPHWLSLLHTKPILTPHQNEFHMLFGIDVSNLNIEEKEKTVSAKASEFGCIILLKAVEDIVSDGIKTVRIQGGNAGLTKGGTGDILAGLVAGLSVSTDPFSSAVVASIILKKTAEHLFEMKGYWYTAKDILAAFPSVFHALISRS